MPRDTTFRDLMLLVDEDFRNVQTSQFERQLLYYTVKINQRETDILGRKTRVPNNNATKLTFLINTPQDNSSRTTLYLTEIDIITVLSTLNEASYEHIKNHLVGIYRKETDPTAHSVRLDRAALVPDTDSITLTANRDVLVTPTPSSNPDIATPFGFTISFQSFCDVLSLILSTENEEKLKISVTKYCVFSTLLRTRPTGIHIPMSLDHITTIQGVEAIYADMRPKDVQRFDSETFTPQGQSDFFGSI